MLLGGACALALALPAAAQPRNFNVPAGELRSALNAYARQAGVQVIYRLDDLRGARSPGVRGSMEPETALRVLLDGTSLKVSRDGSGALAVVREIRQTASRPRPAAPAPQPRPAEPAPAFVGADGAPIDPDAPIEVEGLIVTGSRLPNPNLTATRPVAAVTGAEIRRQGAVRMEDVLNGLPQVFAGQGSEVSNGATGIATVDLRALGPGRTLVLIDGRRIVAGDPTLPVADLNFIPAQLVDRIDVVTGGASAVYGADAVAGVINFIMLKNFEGVRLDLQYAVNQHHNDNPVTEAMRRRGLEAPATNVWDGAVLDLTAVIGVNTGDDRGNATLYATYRSTDPIPLDRRDFAGCPLVEQTLGTGFDCGGSSASAPARILSFDLLNAGLPYDLTVSGTGLRPFDLDKEGFNFAPYNYFQRPDERFTLGGFAHYELSRSVDAYAQLMFMDDLTRATIAPSGVFGQTIDLPCSSPLLRPAQAQALCGAVGLGPDDSTTLLVFRRNLEGQTRDDYLRHTSYRIVAGLRGDVGPTWSYDAYGQYSTVRFAEILDHDFSIARTRLALDVVRDPRSGQAVCRSELDPSTPDLFRGCVPYDIFSSTGPSAAAVDYLETTAFARGTTMESLLSAQVTGSLAEYGVQSPWSTEPVSVALGAEYRREELEVESDVAFLTGDLAGSGGPTANVTGAFDVAEVFAEARVPLVDDAPGIANLYLEAGYRRSNYSTFGAADTYKVAVNWSPIDDLRFRASYNRAVRAPNILELFTPSAVVLGLQEDPCAGLNPRFSLEQCANTGVTPAQYGRVPLNEAGIYNTRVGGNPDLGSEIADSFSAGFVATPRFVPGLAMTLDYFDIKVDRAVTSLSPDFILQTCAITAEPELCARVKRDPATGSLFTGGGLVEATRVNVGYLRTSGLDLEVNYRLPLASWNLEALGAVEVSLLGSWLRSLETAPGVPAPTDPNVRSYDCAGLYGASLCGTPTPRWRHRLRLSWTTPVDGLSLSGSWRRYGGVTNQAVGSDNPYFDFTPTPAASAHLPAVDYFDVTATVRIKDSYTLRLGVNNVLDRDPPLAGQKLGGSDPRFNGNTYPVVYQALGRFIFLGLTADF